ncbi:MAG: hypothetical protein ACOX0R_00210 [Candidatus Dojkabacteria bacterium]|jgi:hypothetical protein
MAIFKKQPKAINLLNPVYSPRDTLSKAYDWMVNIGKYLLIFVEIIVLGVFFSRFVLDRKNTDLTEDIEEQQSLLNTEPWKSNNIAYANYQELLSDVGIVKSGQSFGSSIVSEIVSGIPITLSLKSFSLSEDKVSLSFSASSLEEVKIYESSLKENNRYSNVVFNISKEDVEISVSVTFNLAKNE